MVSIRSATWTLVLVLLVLAAAALVASVAIVAAQAQSVSRHGVPQRPSPTMVTICAMCLGLILATVCAMFGLSAQRSVMLLPLIAITLAICAFMAAHTVRLFVDWLPFDHKRPPARFGYGEDEPTTLATIGAALVGQAATLGALYLEIKCYQNI